MASSDSKALAVARQVMKNTPGHLRVARLPEPDVVVIASGPSETLTLVTVGLKKYVLMTPREVYDCNLEASAVVVVLDSDMLSDVPKLLHELRDAVFGAFGVVCVEIEGYLDSIHRAGRDMIAVANYHYEPCLIAPTINLTPGTPLTAKKEKALAELVDLANSGLRIDMSLKRVPVGQARCYLKAAFKTGAISADDLAWLINSMVRTLRVMDPKKCAVLLKTCWFSKLHGALLCSRAYKKKYRDLAAIGIATLMAHLKLDAQTAAWKAASPARHQRIFQNDAVHDKDEDGEVVKIEDCDSWDEFNYHYNSYKRLDDALREQDPSVLVNYIREAHGCVWKSWYRETSACEAWDAIRAIFLYQQRVVPVRHSWVLAVLFLEGVVASSATLEAREASRAATRACSAFDGTRRWYDPYEDYGYLGNDGQPAPMTVIAQRWRQRAAALAKLCGLVPLVLKHEPRERKIIVNALQGVVVSRLPEVLEEVYGPDEPTPVAYSPLLMATIALAFSRTTPGELEEKVKPRTLKRAKRGIEYSRAQSQFQKVLEFETFSAKVVGASMDFLEGNVLVVRLKPYAKDPCPAFPSICLAMRWGTKIVAFFLEAPELLPEADCVVYHSLETFRTKADVLGSLPLSTPIRPSEKEDDGRLPKLPIPFSELYGSAMNDPLVRARVRAARVQLQELWKASVGKTTSELWKESIERAGTYEPTPDECSVVGDDELQGGHTRASLHEAVRAIVAKMGLAEVKETTAQLPISAEMAACAASATIGVPRWALTPGSKKFMQKVRALYVCKGPIHELPDWLRGVPDSEVPECIIARLNQKMELESTMSMCCVCHVDHLVRDLAHPCSLSENHLICEGCLTEWRRHGDTCPLCRSKLDP